MKNKRSSVAILAGGLGTRLKKYLNNRPKSLVNINDLPLIHYQINQCVKYGFKNIHLLLYHQPDQILNSVSKIKDIEITYSVEEKQSGTYGALYKGKDYLQDNFILLFGDVYFDIDLKNFYSKHIKTNSSITAFVHPNNHPYDSDLIEIDSESNIKKISCYPHKNRLYDNLVLAGLYAFKKKSLIEFILSNEPSKNGISNLLIPKLLDLGHKIYAYHSVEYIKDIGTPDRLSQAENDIKTSKVERLSNKNKAGIFIDRDGTLIENIPNLSNYKKVKFINSVFDAIRLFNKKGLPAFVVTNQPQIAKGFASFQNIYDIHKYIQKIFGEQNTYFEKFYFCPHHPDKGFVGELGELKIKCQCRKPQNDLIKNISSKYGMNFNKSWIIGDSTTDILLGNLNSIKSILVLSGEKGIDNKYDCQPDYVFENLLSAAKFITDDYENLKKLISKKIDIKKIESNNGCLINGPSQSGKSTISYILRDLLTDFTHRKIHIISTDGWLKNKSFRIETENFLHKYDSLSFEKFLDKIFNNQNEIKRSINIPIYNRKKGSVFKKKITYTRDDIFIFEGILTSSSEKLYKLFKNKFYINQNINVLKKRFFREYYLRGLSMDEINNLFYHRQKFEIELIQKNKNKFKIINL